MVSLMPYIGGKHRMAAEIAKRLHATGADTLVDVFGGSAAVTLNAGFSKRVYNDASGDLVCLFRVLADPGQRCALLRRLRWCPPSRRIFADDYEVYRRGALSFALVQDPVERARATLYRQLLSFGGKGRSGGFSVSLADRAQTKEVLRYRRVLRRLAVIGEYFRGTVIENLDYAECIRGYRARLNCVLFCDPPYIGTERYYSVPFCAMDHQNLAGLVATCAAPVVLTYYDSPLLRTLYPETQWVWERVQVTKNCQMRHGNKPKTDEVIITRRTDG